MKKNEETKVVTTVAADLEVSAKVSKEEKMQLKESVSDKQILRFLIDQYYQSQDYRIRAENQSRAILQGYDEAQKEHPVFITKELTNAKLQESLNKKYMDIVTSEIPVCRWMKSIMGIGPVLSCYLYASFDISKGKYATDFLSYAGLNDNNNPWLGTEKAKAMVKKAVDYREKKFFAPIKEIIESLVDREEFEKLAAKTFKKKTDWEFEELDAVFKKMKKEVNTLEVFNGRTPELMEYINTLSNPGFVGSCMYSIIAEWTRRKITNIERGTLATMQSKKTKKLIPTTTELAAYLAKPPYNTDLKKRCYLIGQSFVKVSGKDKSLYGRIYKQRKLEETAKNDKLEYANQAARILAENNYSKNTPTYELLSQGKLSPAHIEARAERYAVKLFISHVFEAMYYDYHHEDAPNPYVISHMGHHDYIAPEIDFKPYIDGLM